MLQWLMMNKVTSWFERQSVLTKVRLLLSERGTPGYLVGGYVRDLLLGRSTRDLDLVVEGDATPLAREAADRLGGAFVLLDEERHTARVVLQDGEERYYLDFATERGDTLEDDLAERDFTVNAMAIDAQDTGRPPVILDPLGAQKDLNRRLLRAVSEKVFRSDPIRLLRAVRFSGQLGFSVEDQTAALMMRDARLIGQASWERIRDELFQILAAPEAGDSLRYVDRLGLLGPLFPELEAQRGVEQPPPHHQDVLAHSLSVVKALEQVTGALQELADGGARAAARGGVEASLGDDFAQALAPSASRLLAHLDKQLVDERGRLALLKLCGLLHDVGKANMAKVGEDRRLHFFGHADEGSAVAQRVARRLRLGNREVRLVRSVVRHHMRPLHLAKLASISRRAIYRFFRDTGDSGVDVLLLSLGDNLALVHQGANTEQWAQISRTVGTLLGAYYERYGELVEPEPLLTGGELLELLGMEPGPAVGRVLQALREAQAMGQVSTKEEAIGLVRSLMKELPD
jgi:tRNA nucleotidyltransferase/poly(A) polymerase